MALHQKPKGSIAVLVDVRCWQRKANLGTRSRGSDLFKMRDFPA